MEVWNATQSALVFFEDALKLGVPNGTFYSFVRGNGLERVSKGVYLHPEAFPDEMQLLQMRFPKAVFLYDTGACIFYVKEAWYDLGITTLGSPEGNPVRV